MASNYAIVNEDDVMPRGDIPIFRFRNMMVGPEETIRAELDIECGISRGYVLIPNSIELLGFINRDKQEAEHEI